MLAPSDISAVSDALIRAFDPPTSVVADPVCECDCDECRSWAELFRGSDWTGHEPGDVVRYWSALSLLTPRAFVQLLPAFLLAELLATGESRSLILGPVLSYLRPEHAELLTPVQRTAVLRAAQMLGRAHFETHGFAHKFGSLSGLLGTQADRPSRPVALFHWA